MLHNVPSHMKISRKRYPRTERVSRTYKLRKKTRIYRNTWKGIASIRLKHFSLIFRLSLRNVTLPLRYRLHAIPALPYKLSINLGGTRRSKRILFSIPRTITDR